MKSILLLGIIFFSNYKESAAQANIRLADIKSIDKNYHACLDKAVFMLGCSEEYYTLIDSCLNIAYRQLFKKLDLPTQEALKKEEKAWLKSRDQNFRSIDNSKLPIEMEGHNGELIREEKKADFVKERLLTLIKRLEK